MSVTTVTGLLAAGSLLLGLGGATDAPPKASGPYPMAQYARVYAPDGTLLSGCHSYRYSYRVDPPTEIWGLETTLIDPRGTAVASGAFLSGSDPKAGKGYFRFCKPSTTPGRFKIRAKFTYKETPGSTPTDGSARTFTYYLR